VRYKKRTSIKEITNITKTETAIQTICLSKKILSPKKEFIVTSPNNDNKIADTTRVQSVFDKTFLFLKKLKKNMS
jgi:hypothetical protein